ncbi:hypothetical protein LCGC14_1223590 [marine sediment metagenome]|uniref:DUF559 domain-containing protein n=1 Tax=marine sediment metagenome TaxID=412755 RepID=A0A0F9PF00_9ZZZZ
MAKCKLNCKCRKHIRTAEHNAKIGVAHRGKLVSAQTCQRISDSKRGQPSSLKGVTSDTSHLQEFQFRPGVSPWNKGKTRLVPNKPRVVTAAHRKNASIAQKRHAAKDLPDCACGVHRPAGKVSRLSGRMIDVFLSDFPEVIREKQFGRCLVDAYLPPPYHLAFEADGEYWHGLREQQDPGYHRRRDYYLKVQFGLTTIRLTESEINEAANV